MPEASTCQMIHPGHPDDPNGEKPCLLPAIGITGENVRVCADCTKGQLQEGFFVIPYPVRQRDLLFPFAHRGGRVPGGLSCCSAVQQGVRGPGDLRFPAPRQGGLR